MKYERQLFINPVSQESENTVRPKGSQNIVRPKERFKSRLFQFFYDQIRTSNVFFLFISILDLFPDLNPGSNYSTIFPLLLLIVMDGLLNLWNYRKRCNSYKITDKNSDFDCAQFNIKGVRGSHKRSTLVGGVEVRFQNSKVLKDLVEGDIIRLKPNDKKGVYVPADIVLLGIECACHQYDQHYSCGRCSISMENLTGDPTILDRQAPEKTAERYKPNLLDYSAVLRYSAPTSRIEEFDGTLEMISGRDSSAPVVLSDMHFVPRGSLLLNAVTVVGMVVYVGEETKIASHMVTRRHRKPLMNELVDKSLLIIIYIISALSIILAICGKHAEGMVEIHLFHGEEGYSFLTRTFQWLMVLQKCVPISLIVSIEFINLILALEISKDETVSDGKAVINPGLVDELGRVTHMFLDKNIAEQKLEVELVGCGKNIIDITTKASMKETDSKAPLDKGIKSEERIKILLAICNRINLDQSKNDSRQFVEDKAQISAAESLGFVVEKKTSKVIIVNAKQTVISFEIIETIPFPSDSDLMGMYFKDNEDDDKTSRLVIKGSPDGIKRFLNNRQPTGPLGSIRDSLQKGVDKFKTIMNTNEESIQDFRARGYQTRWFAEGILNENETAALTEYLESREFKRQENLKKKVQMLTEVLAPKSMSIIGSIGMKQKVDKNARRAIIDLREAGIKMCLVTDDTHENSKLYASELGVLATTGNILSKELPLKEINFDIDSQTLKRLDEIIQRKDERMNLAVSGKSFNQILESKSEEKLQKACEMAKSVIFTSMDSLHSSVRLFTQRLSDKTEDHIKYRFSARLSRKNCVLVVGDSSNDIPMMEEADISVLKNNRYEDENTGSRVSEAANVADFVVKDLRSLKYLILVHGTWNRRSMTQMMYFFIYKNLLLTLIPVLYSLSSGGFDIYSPFNYAMFNAFYTFLFTLCIGCFYKGYNCQEILENPSLYQEKRNRIDTHVCQLAMWCGLAIIHAIILFAFGHTAFGDGVIQAGSGRVAGILDLGSFFFLSVVLTACLKLMFTEAIILPPRKRTSLKPRFFMSKCILSIGSISVLFSIILMYVDAWNFHLPSLILGDNVDKHVSSDVASTFWFLAATLLSVSTCLLVNLAIKMVWLFTWSRGKRERRMSYRHGN